MKQVTVEEQAKMREGLALFFALCGAISAEKGFHERGTFIREIVADLAKDPNPDAREDGRQLLREYQGNRLMLVVGEVSEAHEELRTGHDFKEVYYPTAPKVTFVKAPFANPAAPTVAEIAGGVELKGLVSTRGHKPEGAIVEACDILIRLGDIFAEEDAIEEAIEAAFLKLEYNKSRPRKHGRKF